MLWRPFPEWSNVSERRHMRTDDSSMAIKDINFYSKQTEHRQSVAVNGDRVVCAQYEGVYGYHTGWSGQHQAKAVVILITRYPTNRGFGGVHSRSVCFGCQKKSLNPARNRNPDRPACSLITTPPLRAGFKNFAGIWKPSPNSRCPMDDTKQVPY